VVIPYRSSTLAEGAGRTLRGVLTAALLAAPCATPLAAQDPIAPVSLVPTAPVPAAPAQAPASPAPAEPASALEQLVSRIALYPDDLIAIILPASTNPLQIVQADRYLDKRKNDPQAPVDERWDDSVKSLLNYPEVVKTMSQDLDWTTALGEAVVDDQAQVLAAVQSFRRRTQSAGNLKTDDKQVIVVEKEVIKIVPANPQVIYVPQYNPTTVVVYGSYGWGYYPAPYPVYYYPYPPGSAFAVGLVWGAAISATWHGGYACHYGGGTTVIVRPPYAPPPGYRPPPGYHPPPGYRPPPPGRPGTPTPWSSGKQPGQVSNSIGRTPSPRPGDVRPGAAGGALPSTQPAAGNLGSRPQGQAATPRPATGAGNAFSGYDSGPKAQADSARGASSRSSMSGSRAPSGGARRTRQ